MSFKFNWSSFSKEFNTNAKVELTNALNKSDKPPNIVSDILVTEIGLGTMGGRKPPDLVILEVVELSLVRFRGTFRLSYQEDAFITLQTSVQANPIVHGPVNNNPPSSSSFGSPNIIAANIPLIVPLQLKISKLKLSGIASLVFDKFKGITLAFKNDPLESVSVSSTFDHMSTIRRFLQQEIEKLLMKLFKEDIPGLIHQASMSYIKQNWDPAYQQSSDSGRINVHTWNDDKPPNTPISPQHVLMQWIEPSTGLPIAVDGFDLNREELVRLSRVLHQPPCPPSTHQSSFGIHWTILSSLRILLNSSFANELDLSGPNREGLALALDLEDSLPASPVSQEEEEEEEVTRSNYFPQSIDPREDPGTLFSGLALLLPEWTGNATKHHHSEKQRSTSVHRFNHKYYKKHSQPASVLYSQSVSELHSSSSANSLPTELPSYQKARNSTSKQIQLNSGLNRNSKFKSDVFQNHAVNHVSATSWNFDSNEHCEFKLDKNIVSTKFTTQLANLYLANQSISPYAHHAEHSTFRSFPRKPSSLNPNSNDQLNKTSINKHLLDPTIKQYTISDGYISEITFVEQQSTGSPSHKNTSPQQFVRITNKRTTTKPANLMRCFTINMKKTESSCWSHQTVSNTPPVPVLDENTWATQFKFQSQVYPSCSVSQVGSNI